MRTESARSVNAECPLRVSISIYCPAITFLRASDAAWARGRNTRAVRMLAWMADDFAILRIASAMTSRHQRASGDGMTAQRESGDDGAERVLPQAAQPATRRLPLAACRLPIAYWSPRRRGLPIAYCLLPFRQRQSGQQAIDMPHLAAGARVFLAVVMQERAGVGGDRLPGQNFVANEIDHLDRRRLARG